MSISAPLATAPFFSDFGASNPKPFSFSAGQMLRKAREARSFTLDEISLRLCLSKNIIEALEEGRYRELSQGEAYLIGFVRSYARLVGIDPTQIVLQMKGEFPPGTPTQELIFPVPLPPAGRPKRRALFFSILMMIGVTIAGQKLLMDITFPEFISPVPFVPVQVAVSSTQDKQEAVSFEGKTRVNAIAEDDNPPLLDPSKNQQLSSLIQLPSAEALPPVPFIAVSPQSTTTIHPSSLILEATEKSWIEVRDEQGNLRTSKMMESGDIYEIQENASLLLTTGNIGGLRARQGGETIESLGKKGAVRRKIPLTFATLRSLSTQ